MYCSQYGHLYERRCSLAWRDLKHRPFIDRGLSCIPWLPAPHACISLKFQNSMPNSQLWPVPPDIPPAKRPVSQQNPRLLQPSTSSPCTACILCHMQQQTKQMIQATAVTTMIMITIMIINNNAARVLYHTKLQHRQVRHPQDAPRIASSVSTT